MFEIDGDVGFEVGDGEGVFWGFACGLYVVEGVLEGGGGWGDWEVWGIWG